MSKWKQGLPPGVVRGEGWGELFPSRRWHYFAVRLALCGAGSLVEPYHAAPPADLVPGRLCLKCVKRLAARLRSRVLSRDRAKGPSDRKGR